MPAPDDQTAPLLVVRHAAWEGPHRILDAFLPGTAVQVVEPLAGETLPAHDLVRGAVVMGGPMSVNDTEEHPALADEVAWLARAVPAGLPVLGVCLGAQLLARALGSAVAPGAGEIGWAPVQVLDAADPVVGPLAPERDVLHWHGEAFAAPDGARVLARSARTAVQAFRAFDAWGLLFHAEADLELVGRWLAEPSMAAEARRALGPVADEVLREGARAAAPGLSAARARSFAAFAAVCARRAV
jgi:GMP synthase (glutamine-hydrolysing)